MAYNTITQDFCKTVEQSYSFDERACGLDNLTQGAIVKDVSPQALSDSSRFKRSELAKRLAEEPRKSMLLEVDTNDKELTHLLTEDGVYSIHLPPKSAEGCYIFTPTKVNTEGWSLEQKQAYIELVRRVA